MSGLQYSTIKDVPIRIVPIQPRALLRILIAPVLLIHWHISLIYLLVLKINIDEVKQTERMQVFRMAMRRHHTEPLSQHTTKGECISYLKSNFNGSSFQQQISIVLSHFQKVPKKNRIDQKANSIEKSLVWTQNMLFSLSPQTMLAQDPTLL